jgi:predicted metal-dependent hydrolase
MSEAIPYAIRRSDRARRVRVVVDPERGVEVVIPRRATRRDAAAAVAELRPWIERRVAEAAAARALVASRGDTVPFLGGELRLLREPGRTRAHRRGDTIAVPLEHRGALERWYRREARAIIAPRLDRACAAVGRPYTQLTIRGQRTRWASCSSSGAMSFNWRLLMAPEPVLDYVVWHEACHLVHRDHSARFWGLVGEHCPEHRAHAGWLRRHGGTLTLG